MKLIELVNKIMGDKYEWRPCNADDPNGLWMFKGDLIWWKQFDYHNDIHDVFIGGLIETLIVIGGGNLDENITEDKVTGNLITTGYSHEYIDIHRCLENTDLTMDPNIYSLVESSPKRNYMQVRGKPLTEKQVIDSYARCTHYVSNILKEYNIKSNVTKRSCIPEIFNARMLHPDGYLGFNGNTNMKFVNIGDLLAELFRLQYYYPYWDFAAIFTFHDEIPFELFKKEWELINRLGSNNPVYRKRYAKLIRDRYGTEDLADSVLYGVRVTPGKIEFLNAENAIEVYNEYEHKYAHSDIFKYDMYYYDYTNTPWYPDKIIRDYIKQNDVSDWKVN